MKIGLLGTGAYGMALSSVLIDNNCEVTMWTKFTEEKEQLEKTRKNEKLIPNFEISKKINLTTNIKEAIINKDLLIIAIPAAFIDSVCKMMSPYIKDNHILIATKGIEQETGFFMHEILKRNLHTKNIGVISGPSFAVDLVTKTPVGLSIACFNETTLTLAQKSLETNYLRLANTNDVLGIELCGATKNVLALAAGMLDGLNISNSTQAMFLTEAIHCLEDLLEVFGGQKTTALSFAGIGDLLLTCTSTKSRNYSFGKLIGQRKTKEEIASYLEKNTIEGYYTIESIHSLLQEKDIIVPMIETIYEIVILQKNPQNILGFLMSKNKNAKII